MTVVEASIASLREALQAGRETSQSLLRAYLDRIAEWNPSYNAIVFFNESALADARAICPDLITRPADLAHETAALASLRRWASRYAPMVATDGSDGLMADISGVPHLFGGENAPYVWVGCPAGLSSWDMFDKMLGEAQVVITPGSGFGSAGEGYFRISAFNSRANVEEVCRRLKALVA